MGQIGGCMSEAGGRPGLSTTNQNDDADPENIFTGESDTQRNTQGASVRVDIQGNMWVGDQSTPIWKFCVHSKSDVYDGLKNFAGVVFYKSCNELSMNGIEPGCIHIKDTAGALPCSKEGQVHGRVCRHLTGYDSSELHHKGVVFGGFFVLRGEFKGNSSACNEGPVEMVLPTSGYYDGKKEMTPNEMLYISKVIEEWKQRRTVNFCISAKDVHALARGRGQPRPAIPGAIPSSSEKAKIRDVKGKGKGKGDTGRALFWLALFGDN